MAWWETSSFRLENGVLHLGASPAVALARKHGTPLYVYGRTRIVENYRAIAAAFEGRTAAEVRICYAMKANPHPRILGLLRAEGAWIDAVSPGEVRAARAAGFPARKILFTGTSLGEEDFREAFAISGLTVNIDALEQIELMARIRDRQFAGKRIRVAVRWNPGIGRGFNPKVITAGERSSDGTPIKFGVEDRKVLATFRKAAECGFEPVGLHQHLGSGWVRDDYPDVLEAVDRMIAKAGELENAGFRLEFLDFGGGFGPRYAAEQTLFPLGRYAAAICSRIRRAGLRSAAIAVEPGKSLVADAGALLLRVEYVKESYGNIFACVNGGTFNTLPRSAIYAHPHHEIVNAGPSRDEPSARYSPVEYMHGRVRQKRPLRQSPGPRPLSETIGLSTGNPIVAYNSAVADSLVVADRNIIRVTVAGHICETGDVFGRDVRIRRPEAGDILAVLGAGAYGRSMASNFNLRPIPAEILV